MSPKNSVFFVPGTKREHSNAGLFGTLGDVAGLAQVKVVVLLDDVNAEEGFEVVGFSDCVLFFEDVAEFGDQIAVAGRDGEVVDVDTEVDALAVGVDFEEETRIVGGSAVALAE